MKTKKEMKEDKTKIEKLGKTNTKPALVPSTMSRPSSLHEVHASLVASNVARQPGGSGSNPSFSHFLLPFF